LLAATPALALEIGNIFTGYLNCPTDGGSAQASCLRSMPAAAVLIAQTKTEPNFNTADLWFFPMPWVPVVDGTELPMQPLRGLATGNWNKVPTIMSTVANESVQFVYDAITFPLPPADLFLIEDLLWNNATIGAGVRKVYGMPPAGTTDSRMFVSPCITDYLFYCPTRMATREMAKTLPNQVFFNYFDYVGSWSDWVFGSVMGYCTNVVCHAADLAVIFFPFFAAPANLNPPTPTAAEVNLANEVQSMWGNFARTGNPSTQNINYPPFTPSGSFVFNVSIPVNVIQNFRANYCDFWDAQGYYRF